jgi:hypothetical protein
MTPELQILLGCIAGGSGAMLSYWAGWRARGAQRPSYSSAAIAWQAEDAQRAIDTNARVRRTAELYARFIDPSMGGPWDEGHVQRGNGNGGVTTPRPDIIPKPQFPPPRTIRGNQP